MVFWDAGRDGVQTQTGRNRGRNGQFPSESFFGGGRGWAAGIDVLRALVDTPAEWANEVELMAEDRTDA